MQYNYQKVKTNSKNYTRGEQLTRPPSMGHRLAASSSSAIHAHPGSVLAALSAHGRRLGRTEVRTPRCRVKRSEIAGRAGCWWSCICRCCGSTAEAEIAGDSGCLCPCPPSISAAPCAALSSPASDAVVRFNRPERGKGL